MSQPVSPPPEPASAASSGVVRRHHTISASSRAAHASSRLSVAHDNEQWNEDDVVDQDWEGGMGAVGEKGGGLHRQASLPTRYNRVFQQRRQAGTLTPRTLNSLTAITAEHGHEGEEDDWEGEIAGFRNEDDAAQVQDSNLAVQQLIETRSQASSQSPMSPHFPPPAPSPPPAASGVRRHQSLTYGTIGASRRVNPNLKRSGTLQAQIERPGASANSPSPPGREEDYQDEEIVLSEEEYQYAVQQQQQQQAQNQQGPASPRSHGSPWRTPSEWTSNTNQVGGIDDISRALSSLELSGVGVGVNVSQQQMMMQNAYAGFQTSPRFGLSSQQGIQAPILRRSDSANGSEAGSVSSAQMAPIGHGAPHQRSLRHGVSDASLGGSGSWDNSGNSNNNNNGNKDRAIGTRASTSNLQYGNAGYNPQYITQQGQAQGQGQGQGQPPRLGMMSPGYGQGGAQNMLQGAQGVSGAAGTGLMSAGQPVPPGVLTSPIDVSTLIATKGYNPAEFDLRPQNARFFVIKSYTEDDVHKSLKYEIWSSTDPGNKRLDKAFKENTGKGPIYLFFSVNASGHFCGMAEMLTPVDYTRSSTVWQSDKWKGVFKVRWIFVRDIPNPTLRHIRLHNTQEKKPVTNSRDTQELMQDAGLEMLRIFFSHPAKTSLLQDYGFYELQALQKAQQSQQQQQSPQQQPGSPSQTPMNMQSMSTQGQGQQTQQQQLSPQQHPFAMPNPIPYGTQLGLNPAAAAAMGMNMNMNMNMGMGNMGAAAGMNPMLQQQMAAAAAANSQFSPHPHTIQSVMRNASPIPLGSNNSPYMSMNGQF